MQQSKTCYNQETIYTNMQIIYFYLKTLSTKIVCLKTRPLKVNSITTLHTMLISLCD